jgi:hypothetical protein
MTAKELNRIFCRSLATASPFLVLLVGAIAAFSDGEARGESLVNATVTMLDGSPCRAYHPFFDVNVDTFVTLLNVARNPIRGPKKADEFGEVSLDNSAGDPGLAILNVECGSVSPTVASFFVSGYPFNVPVVLSGRRPAIKSALAAYNGQSVRAVPPGATVRLYARADDLVSYEWRTTDGTIKNQFDRVATWTLPNSKGLHFAYVLVRDLNLFSNGYTEARVAISTDGGVVPARGRAPPVPPQPSDQVPELDHFLTFKGSDSRKGACEYYRAIGAVSSCDFRGVPGGAISFSDWKNAHGFGTIPDTSAMYVNEADLNLTRDMHGVAGPGDVAYYVCNHSGPVSDAQLDVDTAINNAKLGNNLIACVAMDYSVDKPFTKFYTFGPAGDLLLSVNLDGRGEKFMPGTCVACHGGDTYSGRYPTDGSGNPNLGSHFLPFDLGNFRFSSAGGSTKADLQANLKELNRVVQQSTAPTAAVDRLVKGWYCDFEFLGVCFLPRDTQKEDYIPFSWGGTAIDKATYLNVVKPACRTCHAAARDRFDWDDRRNFFGSMGQIQRFVCNRRDPFRARVMPNALVTFNRFWNDFTQYESLRQFFNWTPADCPNP